MCASYKIFIISQGVYPWQAFQAQSNVCGQGQEPTQGRAPERCFTWVGSCLALKHQTRLERLARGKHSSLFQKFVTYSPKGIYNIGPWWHRIPLGLPTVRSTASHNEVFHGKRDSFITLTLDSFGNQRFSNWFGFGNFIDIHSNRLSVDEEDHHTFQENVNWRQFKKQKT